MSEASVIPATPGILRFRVHGIPAPQGSKKGYTVNGKVRMVESSKKVAPWRQDVRAAALEAMGESGWTTTGDPVTVTVAFALPRPRYHFGTGRNADVLKANAPRYVSKKPDLDKTLRSTIDALTEAGVFRDDCQVVQITASKLYDVRPGAVIAVARARPAQ